MKVFKKNKILNMFSAKLPPIIDFLITSRCNLNCRFCFGPEEQQEISFPNLKNLVDKFIQNGVRYLVISGGEPLLSPHLEKLLKFCHQKDVKIVLSTNGISLKKRMDTIVPYLDWLALPIESYQSKLHSELRPGFPNHLELVVGLIKTVRKKYPKLKIKIGTVVNKKNINDLKKIAEFLIEKNTIPDTWKLYQFAARGKGGVKHEKEFKIDIQKFLNEGLKAKKIIKEKSSQTRVVFNPDKKFEGTHLFMYPNADAVCVRNGQYQRIGNFWEDFDEVVKNWKKYISLSRLKENFNLTYKIRL